MLTPEGWRWVAEQTAERIRAGAWIVVADESGNSAVGTIGAVTVEETELGARVISSATFPENEANFEWLKRSIKFSDNTVLDREVEDLGRKAQGAEWDIEVAIDFGAEA